MSWSDRADSTRPRTCVVISVPTGAISMIVIGDPTTPRCSLAKTVCSRPTRSQTTSSSGSLPSGIAASPRCCFHPSTDLHRTTSRRHVPPTHGACIAPQGLVHAPFLWSFTMSLDTVSEISPQDDLLDLTCSPLTISLPDFVSEFGDELLDSLNRANPPVYTGQARAHRQLILASLKRRLFPAQADVVHAVTELLIDRGERAAIVNGEMGCGKTTVGIATAAVLNAEGYRRTLVLSPPHLVYKWRREIQETVAGAKVWVLNGPDTLVKLLKLREQLGVPPQGQEFFVLGRVRMRLGFHWKPVFARRRTPHGDVEACPYCGEVSADTVGGPVSTIALEAEEARRKCRHCTSPPST